MSLWKKPRKPREPMSKAEGQDEPARTAKPRQGVPRIDRVTPQAAIPGGEIAVEGSGFTANGHRQPLVHFGSETGSLVVASPNRLVVRVPDGVASGDLTVESPWAVSAPVSVAVGLTIAENVHPVANPAVDAAGNIFTTFSGPRGQKVPVSVYKIDRHHSTRPFLSDLLNPTGLAFDREGLLYISSRAEGTIYQVTPDGHRAIYAEGMGIATGIAFDRENHLYVGDRSGTIFKINPDRQIFVFATIEPSVAAYHLAFGPEGNLYVSGPTTSSFDHVYSVNPAGQVSTFYRGLGRPQGMAFDSQGNLYVAASLAGQRGVVRIAPGPRADLVVSGHGVVGLAFTPHRSLILATANELLELFVDVEGRPLLQ